MQGLRARHWSPFAVGAGIGVLSSFAFATAAHGLGITTPFESTAALLIAASAPSVAGSHPYFASRTPMIDWEWMLVVGVFLGSLLSSSLSRDRTHPIVPTVWRDRFGSSALVRMTAAFAPPSPRKITR